MQVEQMPYTYMTLNSGDDCLDTIYLIKGFIAMKHLTPEQQKKVLEYLIKEIESPKQKDY